MSTSNSFPATPRQTVLRVLVAPPGFSHAQGDEALVAAAVVVDGSSGARAGDSAGQDA